MTPVPRIVSSRPEGVADLRRENAALHGRLDELQAALAAVRSGSADAIVSGPADPPVVLVREDSSERQRRALLSVLEDQKHAQAALRRLNRALQALSAGNSAVIHAETEPQLLQTMCEVAVKIGGYKLAWVGFAGQDEARTVKVVARAGAGEDGVQADTWADDAPGHGPAGRCIRTGTMQLASDATSEPALARWWEQARKDGHRAAVALPLAGTSGVFGAFTLCAADPEAFDEEELALLSEMAGAMAYGIAALRAREAQHHADEQARALARFPEENPNAVMRVDGAGVLLYANPASQGFRGGCGARVGEMMPEPYGTLARKALSSGSVGDAEREMGEAVYAITLAPVSEGSYVNIYATDITARRRAEQTLRSALTAVVGAVGSVVEQRDPYTAGHQRKVAELASAIAEELGWAPDRIEGLRLASTIHDVGKISVPTEILVKPGRLSPLEFELVKRHAEAGFEIIKGIAFPWPLAEIVRQHHERLDGSGYPRGLKGDEILPEAQVLAVADTVEAMSSHRPYRAGLGLEAALKEIERRKGKALNAEAVDVCLKLFRDKGFKLVRPA